MALGHGVYGGIKAYFASVADDTDLVFDITDMGFSAATDYEIILFDPVVDNPDGTIVPVTVKAKTSTAITIRNESGVTVVCGCLVVPLLPGNSLKHQHATLLPGTPS